MTRQGNFLDGRPCPAVAHVSLPPDGEQPSKALCNGTFSTGNGLFHWTDPAEASEETLETL
jgi:hypothetical protein